MALKDIFPLKFNYTFDDYRMLMRSILIKSIYDNKIKSLSQYKGMHKSNYFNECWTVKFGYQKGIYGLMLSEVEKEEGVFVLYYFPSASEECISSNSIFENLLIFKEDYLEKIRNFSSYEELIKNFAIAKIKIKVKQTGIFLSFNTKLRDRAYAIDGVEVNGKTIIEKDGIDKNNPSFRLSLAFINFLHLALSQIYSPNFKTLKVYKKAGVAIVYDCNQNFTTRKDVFCSEIYLNLFYGENYKDYILRKKGFNQLSKNSIIYKFLLNLEKNSKKISLKNFKNKANFFIITGYLGSGKTKFLQNFIEHETSKNRFTGVIQNEIGTIGLDGQLLDAKYALVEIDEGCVCCSMSGQIRLAVDALKDKKPDSILLETTGVANPFNLLSELDDIKDIVNLSSIITIVDGANFLVEYKKSKILLEQIKAADIILLNKIDLISIKDKLKIKDILAQNNRCADIFETINGELNPNFLLYSQSQTSYIASVVIEGKLHATHSNEGILSFKKELNDNIDKDEFLNYIKTIPKNFFRIKGLLSFRNDTKQYVFQFVNGRYDISIFDVEKRCENFLIFIGRNIDKNFFIPKIFLSK